MKAIIILLALLLASCSAPRGIVVLEDNQRCQHNQGAGGNQ